MRGGRSPQVREPLGLISRPDSEAGIADIFHDLPIRASPDAEFELEIVQADSDRLGTRVGLRLEPRAGGSWVHFYHTGWPSSNEHYRISCNCWAMYPRVLRRSLEPGESVACEDRLDAWEAWSLANACTGHGTELRSSGGLANAGAFCTYLGVRVCRTTLIATLLVLSSVPGFAQIPDTLDAHGYFPLGVGNSWEYVHDLHRFSTGDETRYERYAIVGSSATGTEEQFTLVVSERSAANELLSRDTLLVRFDEDTSSVLGENLRGVLRFLTCLDSPFSPSLVDPMPPECWPFVSRDSVWHPPLFGEMWTRTKRMESFVWSVHLVHGIGAFSVSGGCEPCGPFDDYDSWALRYASIAGEQFGTSVIAIEARQSARTSAARVYPNPARTWALVESESPVEVTVYDILGRSVRRADVDAGGRARIDLADLRPGVYLVRIGLQTRTLVVH